MGRSNYVCLPDGGRSVGFQQYGGRSVGFQQAFAFCQRSAQILFRREFCSSEIENGDCAQLVLKINNALDECNEQLEIMELNKRYHSKIRKLFIPHCLITPGPLKEKDTEFLAVQTFLKTKRDPLFISSYEVMVKERSAPTLEEWNCLVDFLIENRVFIVESWPGIPVGNIERFYFEYPNESATSFEHRGEADASFASGKATIAIVVWKGNEVIWTEIYRDIACSSSVTAEAYAVLALMFKCLELGINSLSIWTDNESICDAINGSLTINSSPDKDILLLLGFMRKRFIKLLCTWKPRQLMFLSDSLTKLSVTMYMSELLPKFAYELSGKPLFKITQSAEARKIINNFVCREYKKPVRKVYKLDVEEDDKMTALRKIIRTLCPSKVILALDKGNVGFLKELKDLYDDGCHSYELKGNMVVGTVNFATPEEAKHHLFVVVDSKTIAGCHEYLKDPNGFSVIFVKSGERLSLQGVKLLDALSFVYFHGTIESTLEAQQLRWKDWKAQVTKS